MRQPMQEAVLHHAFVMEAEAEEGIAEAEAWLARELGFATKANPDAIVLRYSLFSVDDARRVAAAAAQAPLIGDVKAVIIAASRAYHEAQNALLKLFEEPPRDTYLFLVLPSLGQLLPTLRSRVQVLKREGRSTTNEAISEIANEFITGSREKRSAIAKKLATGRDEDERRANRDAALGIVNGIEAAAYDAFRAGKAAAPLLEELAKLRGHLHDRSAPVRMILEHLALVVPRNLLP